MGGARLKFWKYCEAGPTRPAGRVDVRLRRSQGQVKACGLSNRQDSVAASYNVVQGGGTGWGKRRGRWILGLVLFESLS